jgi:hypothetical protein
MGEFHTKTAGLIRTWKKKWLEKLEKSP